MYQFNLFLETDRQFKKREIKCRNYRKTESFNRRSVSPDYRNKKSRSSSSKKSYPKNWIEYNHQKLTTIKDQELKAKVFNQKAPSHLELGRKLYNYDTPSPFMEPFKCLYETGIEEVPFFHLR